MASGTLQEDGEYVVRTQEEVAVPQPDLTSACGRAEANTQVQEDTEEQV